MSKLAIKQGAVVSSNSLQICSGACLAGLFLVAVVQEVEPAAMLVCLELGSFLGRGVFSVKTRRVPGKPARLVTLMGGDQRT